MNRTWRQEFDDTLPELVTDAPAIISNWGEGLGQSLGHEEPPGNATKGYQEILYKRTLLG
jgi:hypothetical protein